MEALVGRLVDLGGTSSADILEVGCAPGRFLSMIGKSRPQHRLAGVDLATDAVARMREAGCQAELFEGDVRTVELPRKFDVVLSFGLLEHFDDPVEIVRAHARHAKAGGHVAVTVPNYAAPPVRALLQRFSPRTIETHNLELMHPDRLASTLLRAGLTDVDAGAASGPVLPSTLADRNLSGQLYRVASRVWNVGTSFVPFAERLWQAHLWAHGRVT
jgi:SAM-dependent methyltransferase